MAIKLFDAHMHLVDPNYDQEREHILSFLRKYEMHLLANSSDLQTSIKTLEISEKVKGKIFPFVGIHPWSSKNANIDRFKVFLEKNRERICGIGEIGLDRKCSFEKQTDVFEEMLQLAEKLEKPVNIHSRGTMDKVINILSTFKLKKVLLHWFTGNSSQLRRSINKGYFLSFGPTVIYSKKTKRLAARTPHELILTETDGPVPYPCFWDKKALPTFLSSVVFSLSDVCKKSFDEIAEIVSVNSQRYIGNL